MMVRMGVAISGGINEEDVKRIVQEAKVHDVGMVMFPRGYLKEKWEKMVRPVCLCMETSSVNKEDVDFVVLVCHPDNLKTEGVMVWRKEQAERGRAVLVLGRQR